MMNIHCQPAMPCVSWQASITHPDSGPPRMPANGTAVMNTATIWPRRFDGNQ